MLVAILVQGVVPLLAVNQQEVLVHGVMALAMELAAVVLVVQEVAVVLAKAVAEVALGIVLDALVVQEAVVELV